MFAKIAILTLHLVVMLPGSEPKVKCFKKGKEKFIEFGTISTSCSNFKRSFKYHEQLCDVAGAKTCCNACKLPNQCRDKPTSRFLVNGKYKGCYDLRTDAASKKKVCMTWIAKWYCCKLCKAVCYHDNSEKVVQHRDKTYSCQQIRRSLRLQLDLCHSNVIKTCCNTCRLPKGSRCRDSTTSRLRVNRKYIRCNDLKTNAALKRTACLKWIAKLYCCKTCRNVHS